jgi:outer membrane lipoprotein-sorting protein
MEINPSEIFTIYQKGFLHKYIGEKTIAGKACQIVELTPEDKKKPYFKVKLAIDKRTNKVEEMEIFNKNGVTTKYKITSFTGNIDINDSFFKFDPKLKPGVEIIDLR